jgi:excisionase family DNA binding protein
MLTTHDHLHGSYKNHHRPPVARPLTIEDVAEHLGVTVRHVRRLVAERRIPFIKWGHLLRFDPSQIAEWLASRQVPIATRTRLPTGVAK